MYFLNTEHFIRGRWCVDVKKPVPCFLVIVSLCTTGGWCGCLKGQSSTGTVKPEYACSSCVSLRWGVVYVLNNCVALTHAFNSRYVPNLGFQRETFPPLFLNFLKRQATLRWCCRFWRFEKNGEAFTHKLHLFPISAVPGIFCLC